MVRDGRILQRARKSLLPNYRYFDDKRFFTPGRGARAGRRCAPRRAATRVGVSICEDMWDDFYDVKPLPELAAKGASVLLNINASPFYPGKRHERDALIRRHIHQVRKPLVYVNTAGAADNGKNIIPFDGESLVYDEHGPPDRDRPAVRRGPAGRRPRRSRAARRARSCRRSTASASSTTRC